MPLATTCRLNKREVDVDDAVELRDEAKRSRQPTLNFRCLDCDEPVRPHRGGGHASAHFEHLDRNPACPLSHRARS